jgi:putative restriction endonuclease
LALRTDVHRLFDRGYVTIDEANRFVVGRRLREDFENGRSYYDLHGRRLVTPADPRQRPDPALLDWHRTSTFLG